MSETTAAAWLEEEKIMRVLVFDPNVDFARRVVGFIRENVKNVQADMASNLFVLRKRLREGVWDFVLADVAAAGFMRDVINELNGLQCPVIIWSTLLNTENDGQRLLDKFRIVVKPVTSLELSSVLHSLVETA